jgi:hypothetical protein
VAIDQISVFLENRTGGAAAAVEVLAKNAVDIRALALADEADFGILRLIVDDTDRAVWALGDAGYTVRRTPVVAVRIPDRPGGLSTTMNALRAIPVEYMYAFVQKAGEQAVVVFRFEDPTKASEALRAAGARLLEAADVERM